MNRFVGALSRLLDPAEREYVCGDLEELQLRTPAAALGILGLLVRRQLAVWLNWGPWVALLGVAGLTGFFLSGWVGQIAGTTFVQVRTFLSYGVAYEPGGVSALQQITYAATGAIALLLWCWASGFILAVLSGRALWMTCALFYIVVRESSTIRMALAGNIILKHGLWPALVLRLFPLEPLIAVCIPALLLGLRSGRRSKLKQSTSFALSAAGLASVLLLTWMQSWYGAGFAQWSGDLYAPGPFFYRALPVLACAWPVLSIPLCEKTT